MRVLVITNMYPPHHLGGYELACRDAVARWREHGHDVHVLTSDIRFPHAAGSDEGDARRALRIYWKDGLITSPAPHQRLAMELHNARTLRSALAQARPDVVSLWHMGAVPLSIPSRIARAGIPIGLVLYDDWLVYGREVDGWMRVFANRPWAQAPVARLTGIPTTVDFGPRSVACFMSQWLRTRAEGRSPLDLPQRREIVYGGIDLGVFNGGDDHRPWNWKLLVAGRIEARKGVHVAVEAMAHLPEATLDIVGPPDDVEYVDGLHRRAADLGLSDRIRWVGPVSRDALADAFRSTDVFLFPVVWDEPFGMVPLEAMACGAAVIGTGTGGSDEFLHHERNCLRVETEDAVGMARAVRRLATDDALRTSIVAAGRETAQGFSDARFYDGLEAHHAELLRT